MNLENSSIIDYVAMGGRIRQARKSKKMTQAELAELIGVSTSYIGHIERGIKRCSLDAAAALCMALEMDADLLIFGKAGRPDRSDRSRAVISEFLQKVLVSLEN